MYYQPFLQPLLFSNIASLELQLPTDLDIAKFCSTITSMPKLTRISFSLRPPSFLDKRKFPSAYITFVGKSFVWDYTLDSVNLVRELRNNSLFAF